MKVNPRDYLGDKSPYASGIDNKLVALSWIYRWGYTSSKVIQLVLRKESGSWAGEKVQTGWLRRTAVHSGTSGAIFTLSNRGFAWIEERVQVLSKYKEIDPQRIAQSTIHHNLLAQEVTVQALLSGEALRYRTERQDATQSRRGEKRPDVLWISANNERVGIEMELTSKWDQRFDEFITSTIAALSPAAEGGTASFDKFIIFTTSKAIAARYGKSFESGAKVRVWRTSLVGTPVVDRVMEVPSWISGCVEFRVIER